MGTLELSNLIQLEINENLRNISIPKKGVVFGVDGDIEVNRVAFVFPRYYSNFDMTEFSARVNYVNANGEANYYEADDMSSDDGDTATFSWLMTSDVTSYIGEVRFSVLLYKRLDERYVKKFGTRPATGRVLEGLDVESYVTPEQQLTLIEKMEKKFDAYVEAKMLSVNHDIEDAKNGALDAIEEAKNDVDSFIASSKSEIDSLLSSSLDDIKNLTDTSKLNISTLTDEKLASLDKETVRQLKNIELAGVEETEKIRTAFSSAVSDIQAEGQKQADAVDSHGDSKIKEIDDSTATSLANINSISEKQVEAIQLEGTKQTSSVNSEGNKQVSTVASAGATEVTKVKSASSTALSNIDSAKEYSISEITAKGTEQVKIIKDTSTSEISKVQEAGISQVKSVSDEGKIQIDGVKSEGEKQVQSVSAKGTQSLQDIDTAKTAAVKSINDQTKPIIDKVEQLKQNVNDKSDSVDEAYEQMKKLHCIEISEEAPTNERTGLWVNPKSNEEINIPEIKDEEVSGIDTWSSQKINHEIDSLKEDLGDLNTSVFNIEDSPNIFDKTKINRDKALVTWGTPTMTNYTYDKAGWATSYPIAVHGGSTIHVYKFKNGVIQSQDIATLITFTKDGIFIAIEGKQKNEIKLSENTAYIIFDISNLTFIDSLMLTTEPYNGVYQEYGRKKEDKIAKIAEDVSKINSDKTHIIFSFDAFKIDNRFELMKSYGFPFTIAIAQTILTYPISKDDYYNYFIDGNVDFSVYAGKGDRPSDYRKDKDKWSSWVKGLVDGLKETSGLYYPVMYSCQNAASSDILNQVVKENGFRMCRNGTYYNADGTTTWVVLTDRKYLIDGTKYFDYYPLSVVKQEGYPTIEQIKAEIDNAIEKKKSIMLFTHYVIDDTKPMSDTDCPLSKFTDVLDYVKEKVDAGLCDVKNARQFWNYYNQQDGLDIDYKRTNMRNLFDTTH